MIGRVDSLNLGVAASLMLYEVLRARLDDGSSVDPGVWERPDATGRRRPR